MVIDADIYDKIMEFKAKNETIKINPNYSNVDKNFWKVKYVNEHHVYDKNNAGYINVGGSFHKKPGVIVSGENVWTNKYVKMCEIS